MQFFLGTLIILSLFMIYYDYIWYGEKIVPVPFVSVAIATTLAFIYLIIKKFIEKSPIRIAKEFRIILIFSFVVQLSFFGLYFNDPTNEKVFQFFKTDIHFLFYVLFIFVIIQLFNKPSFQKLLRFYYFCGIIVAFFGVLQFIHLNLFQLSGMDRLLFGCKELYTTGPIRITSIFNEPSGFSFFLLDWMGIGLAYSLTGKWKREFLVFIPLIIALFFSASLGSYIGLLALIFLVSYEFPTSRRQLFLIVIIIVIPMMFWEITSQFFAGVIGGRIIPAISGIDPSVSMRLDSAQAAFQVWLRNPIVGVGIGNASFHTYDFYKGIWWHSIQSPKFHIAADNAYSLILAENGAIGFIFFIIMIFAIIKQPWSVRSLKSMLYKQSFVEEPGKNFPDRDLWIFTRMFRIIVIMSFIELFLSCAFLFPRLWFNVGIYLFLKEEFRKKFVGSPKPLFSEIHGSRSQKGGFFKRSA